MNCPKCGFEQQAGETSCAACGIVFARWQARAAASGVNPPPAAAHAPEAAPPVAWAAPGPESAPPRDVRLLLGGAGALLAAIVGLILLQVKPGLPVPAGALTDEKHAFAVKPGDDWLTLSAGNMQEMARRFGGDLPPAVRAAMNQSGAAIAFVRLPEGSEFPPSFNLVVIKQRLPRLNERALREAREAIIPELKKALGSYELETDELTRLDGVGAVRFVGRTSFPYRRPDGGRGEYRVRVDQRMAPGRNEALMFSCMEDADDYDRGITRCDPVWESLRILARPPRAEGMALGALRGLCFGLFGGGISLLVKFFLA